MYTSALRIEKGVVRSYLYVKGGVNDSYELSATTQKYVGSFLYIHSPSNL